MIEMIETAPTFRMPPAPQTLEATGVPLDVVLQLVTKSLYFAGELSGTELAHRLGVLFTVVEPCIAMLKRERHCEIVGGGTVGAASYRYRLTEAGRTRAMLFLEHSQYVGSVPVPHAQYLEYMHRFVREHPVNVTREAIKRAFSHLVISDRVLDQLGPAIAAWHSLFVYGPPGNGKTVISEAIRNILVGDIAIPHALSIDGHVVGMLDPVIHERVDPGPSSAKGLERDPDVDHRWVRCRRPQITVGGELTLESLELGYSASSGLYRAPLQALANGGVLVIDDFGRQHASPRDLLNRWIVPLESRVDYLTLQTGQKFHLPFDTFVVFATNLNPSDLVDEAFLRRIQYKVLAESPTAEEFTKIFENCCRDRGLKFDRKLVETLIDTEIRPRQVRLRGCQPRDLIEHALSLAHYFNRKRELTGDLLASACDGYFVSDERDVASA
jgi:predicted ATPase with chaperone activity